eukprot:TRINITY_DN4496_c8_g1_i1.p1 TRINITY_DN4496_c8_g1~~TRINITY_DN4496_c8_g1_i1.p1  ORF type:complete len:208 (+),score=8.25 TRINITY_DN4496_c8_g1_i1:75-698(+)
MDYTMAHHDMEGEIAELAENIQAQQRTLARLQGMLEDFIPVGKREWDPSPAGTPPRRRPSPEAWRQSTPRRRGTSAGRSFMSSPPARPRSPWNKHTRLGEESPSHYYTKVLEPMRPAVIRPIDIVNHFPIVSWGNQWNTGLRSPCRSSPRSPRKTPPPVQRASSSDRLQRDNQLLQERCKLLENQLKLKRKKTETRPRWNSYQQPDN